MKTITLDTFAGDTFGNVAKLAKETSENFSVNVEFDFNGIKCIVNKNTNLDYLHRDYTHAYILNWKEIGPNCEKKYSIDIEDDIKRITEERNIESETKQELYKKESKNKKSILFEKIKDEILELNDIDGWNDYRDKNSDPYGKAIFEYAEIWAKLMQIKNKNGISIIDCADKTSHEADYDGITGFMYGAAVQILSTYWKHGEQLRKWHNKEYKYDGDGIVNPAVLNIKV